MQEHRPSGNPQDGDGETFPWSRGCPFAPPGRHGKYRDEPSLTRAPLVTGKETWIVTRYEEVREALNDERLSNDRAHPGFPSPIPIPPDFTLNASLLGMDPPVHTEYRRRVAKEFTTRSVGRLRDRVQRHVDDHLGELERAGPPQDLVTAFALPLTMSVICEMLGIPQTDRDFLHARTKVMFGGAKTAEERKKAVNELDAYFTDLVTGKYDDPGDDVISRLTGKFPRPSELEQLVHLTRLLFNGGHDSTASMISLGTLALLRNPGQLKLLKDDPGLAEQATEELLRLLTVTENTTARVAKTDFEIRGTPIKAGDGVFPLTAAANHDPEAFERPEELDITRGSRKHVAFGHGRHMCLGSELARLELELVFASIFQRLPGLSLAVPFEELSYREGGLVFSVAELPLTW